MKAKMPSGAPSDLSWIETNDSQSSDKPNFSEFNNITTRRTFKTIFIDKCTDNIIVPICLTATVTCLTMGLLSMKNGDRFKQQMFMRGRVGFQAATLAAMAFTMYFASRKKERAKAGIGGATEK